MANTMYFKGESNLAHKVVVTDYPAVPAPPERGDWETILGREGDVWQGEGVYEQATIAVVLWVRPNADLVAVRNWLTGAGTLRFGVWNWSMEARVSAKVDFAPAPFNDGWTATVTFSARPAWYKYPAGADITRTSSGVVTTNLGKVDAYPILKVNGSGNITLMVGARTIMIYGLSGSITIDCELLTASDTSKIEVIDDLWPILTYPSCPISWVGSVTSVVITPRWRLA